MTNQATINSLMQPIGIQFINKSHSNRMCQWMTLNGRQGLDAHWARRRIMGGATGRSYEVTSSPNPPTFPQTQPITYQWIASESVPKLQFMLHSGRIRPEKSIPTLHNRIKAAWRKGREGKWGFPFNMENQSVSAQSANSMIESQPDSDGFD